jgi:ABC-type multidrug transport system fused ATPase/permease subunit
MDRFAAAKAGVVYIGRMFKALWGNDKRFMFILLCQAAISSVLPFTGMYLTKTSIDMLTSGAGYASYLPVVLLLLCAVFALTFLASAAGYFRDIHGNMFGNILAINVYKKSLDIDFEMLLDKKILEKREMAGNRRSWRLPGRCTRTRRW